MSQKFNLAKFFGTEADESDPADDDQVVSGGNVVPMSRREPEKNNILIIEPINYSEVENIGKKLLNGEAVIVKLTKLDIKASARMIDFLNGVLFAIHGSIERLDQDMFICSPNKFTVSKNNS